ncbi:hypothetical protein [Aneurinibacillus aneurinilyticus]|uniref:hypothetical protein n=1 Tax=Aneurinibacillus aneurinilyticus TaxID=1391 RepID=UPI0012DEC4A0|nr:hypothetical protein [Aneurinibacillus aneurinilyticus]MED0705904.1 hypothetical protein [Aneurinibacillus aneurinilyticus]MED0722707.1 hypothetical protein [Aneurinibacillus aneurinilyticus]MED0731373.1 hypothetical protein [Aneurinibacillus aneurinilyticus]MED0740129.1 hypothetical protein [Aneurinibacillus aneurinilyticus]
MKRCTSATLAQSLIIIISPLSTAFNANAFTVATATVESRFSSNQRVQKVR